ncbi:MAG TPA: hypothetical protein PLA68_05040, partial [Panacibacter sp.]|nr:hypothetical protein [Panacibacter sp.]
MKVSNLIPKSRLSFSVFIIILFAIFFIGYYFYYIPVNREELHKDGFLILKNIKTSIEERNSDLQKLYKAFFKKNFDENKSNNDKYLQNLLDSNEVSGKVFKAYGASSILSPRTLSDSAGSGMQRNEVRLAEIKKGNLIYLANNKNYDSLAVALPVDKLLDPILQSQKTELFGSYLLINKRQGLIYKDKDLSIGSGLAIDSLLSKNKDALFAGIKDARIEDVDYKVFYYPFDLGNEEVELCGFVKTSEYNERLHNIPVTFIYPIVILFLLLLIFLPLIKFYLMGPDEHVKFIDIAFSVLSFFVGATLLTLIMIQVLLLMAADIRAKEHLSVLATQIDSSFSQELNASYRQLDSLDNFMSRSLDKPAVEMLEKGKNLNVSDLLKKYFYTHHNDTSLYYNFNRIFWVDTMGWQRVKGQLENTDPVFTNVSARNYFKVFKNNEPFLLPGQQESQFGFEPVNSWTDGEFRIVVSKKSNLKGEFITALATQMYSVTQTILPPGYGFCIIDKDGNVQLHSEMERNLQENILEKIASSRQIKESITSRQETFFNSLNFYGKTNAVTIQPVSKIPFYIITFCDKGYIVPVNMRIFSFALLFCFITFFTCMLIWFFVFRKRYYSYPMLYPPLLFLKWAIPKKSSMQFYVLGTRFLSGYASMLLIFLVLAGILKISNYVILVLVFMIPANVISGLFVLTYATIKQNDSNRKEKITQWSKKALTAISFQLTASVAIYFLSYSAGYAIELHFLIFQLLFNSVMWMYYFSSQKTLAYISKSTKHYVSQYSRLATLLIICLAVLPAGLYTWYAHNQEITQSLKKEQLYLAE